MTDDNGRIGEALIYIGYGELMRRLQVLEMSLWQVQSLRFKRGVTAEQAMKKVHGWDGATFGKMWGGMKSQGHWPENLIHNIDQAVGLRNHLAHHFLREFFAARPSQESYRAGADQLVEWSQRMDQLEAELTEHLRTLGMPDLDDLDDETLADLESLRPDWPL
ncbi:hypothetical protein [Segeticoccus rhizosphaerae]|uniref:hypothetical protein n=1 Tax=Segeticoccus rhizosphaerae TaxID=1104777 RepID=UPI0010C0C4FD|nr:hypothetical protein [Ornithinicoccus soli]